MTVVAQGARRGDWMQVATGMAVWPLDPRPGDIRIEDIAHSLSNLCRFNGHTNRFYSVAQHCVLVSQQCPPDVALWGLLHDASEAYLADVPRPLKAHLPGYSEMEACVMRAVCLAFDLPPEMPDAVKALDDAILADEWAELMGEGQMSPDLGSPIGLRIVPWTPQEAKTEFLYRFRECLL